MTTNGWKSAAAIATVAGALTSVVATSALAQSPDAVRTLANGESLFIDGRTFSMTPGKAKGDAIAQIEQLGPRELGAGAIIFRSGDRLYIADSAPLPQSAMAYESDIERQRPLGLRDADVDVERQRPLGLRSDVDYERQRPLGLRSDVDYERQRPLGLRSDVDYERQRPLGLRSDIDYDRQRPLGLRSDVDVERQRPLGLQDSNADIARQRPLGLRSDVDVERQRPLGLTDTSSADQRVYINDPDYTYYRLKKAFDEIWGSSDKK